MIYASVHGRLSADPVTSETKSGKPMVRASVAVDVKPHNAEEPETIWVFLLGSEAAAEALDRVAEGETVVAQVRMTLGQYTGREPRRHAGFAFVPNETITPANLCEIAATYVGEDVRCRG